MRQERMFRVSLLIATTAAAMFGMQDRAMLEPAPLTPPKPISVHPWEGGIDMGGLPASSPAVSDDGIVYAEVSQGQTGQTVLEAFGDRQRLTWKVAVGPGRSYSAPAIGPDGAIYVSSWDHKVYAISLDGHLKWMFETGGAIHENPTIRIDGELYVSSDDGYLYAIKPTGKLDWKYKIGGLAQGKLAVDPYGTVYADAPNGDFFAFSPTGTLRWTLKLDGTLEGAPAIAFLDRTVYVILSDNHLYAITRAGGIRWKRDVGETTPDSPMASANDVLYYPADRSKAYIIGSTGELLRTINSNPRNIPFETQTSAIKEIFPMYGKPAYHNLTMFAIDVQGRLFAFLLGMA